MTDMILKREITKICFMFLVALIFASCSTQYAVYSNEMFLGKKLFQVKDYEKAREYFIRASQAQQDSASLALLGSAYYKTGDMANAERAILEAERIDKNSYYRLRILGYKSLVLLRQNKQEGFDTLKQYAAMLKGLNLPFETYDIDMMIDTKRADLGILDARIEEQSIWYENEMERFNAGEPNYFTEKFDRAM